MGVYCKSCYPKNLLPPTPVGRLNLETVRCVSALRFRVAQSWHARCAERPDVRQLKAGVMAAVRFIKRRVARWILRGLMPALDGSSSAVDRLLGQAVRLQLGQSTDEAFRQELADFYRQVAPEELAAELRFDALRHPLSAPRAYKVAITRLANEVAASDSPARWSAWQRRFGLLYHLGVRLDILVLRRGEQIPPHGHRRIVSGFYVLEGAVACRHYDCVGEERDHLLVRQTFDRLQRPGDFSTNSERRDNIHWLEGVAPVSYLFRVTVHDTPRPQRNRAPLGAAGLAPDRQPASIAAAAAQSDRIYVDPTGPADSNGLIRAPRVSEAIARGLRLVSVRE